ncbi:hypothetical protein KRMM14A1259_44540 [Krasilnikovia sp. MM14-A1259]
MPRSTADQRSAEEVRGTVNVEHSEGTRGVGHNDRVVSQPPIWSRSVDRTGWAGPAAGSGRNRPRRSGGGVGTDEHLRTVFAFHERGDALRRTPGGCVIGA